MSRLDLAFEHLRRAERAYRDAIARGTRADAARALQAMRRAQVDLEVAQRFLTLETAC